MYKLIIIYYQVFILKLTGIKRCVLEEYKRIYLADYKPCNYEIKKVLLWIDFFEEKTFVRSKLIIEWKDDHEFCPVVLKGEELVTLSLLIDGKKPLENQYEFKEEELLIYPEVKSFEIETLCEIYPEKNTSLEGIYKSESLFCSQCEAEGFRKITWHPDRPDLLSEFICNITADKSKYPVLLSNGNPVDKGDFSDGRHFVRWHDPFLKPSYLFAVVAGNLFSVEDEFITMSGRKIGLKIFTESENLNKCFYAMESLKKSMKWDEEVFGREYDLDIYMIVAVRAFNMGAMENKGLNIFNSSYVLADDETGTDQDFLNINSVVSHEYFHNWTGNRVTLANWFQLSLKEGLTVFRDQLFSEEEGAGSISRIKEVRALKARQFPEDAGPFSHPVRPDSYVEMNNFYTATVYEKGAEIIRMIYNWAGRKNFLEGMNAYFEEFDSKAVRCEDFIDVMTRTTGKDFWPFMRWYEQKGTPNLDLSFEYDDNLKVLKGKITQKIFETSDSQKKLPVPVPVKISFFDETGAQVPFRINDDNEMKKEHVFLLENISDEFIFHNINEKYQVSAFRDFSAPVRYNVTPEINPFFLMSYDNNPYNRWHASRLSYFKVLMEFYFYVEKSEKAEIPLEFLESFLMLLKGDMRDKSLKGEIIDPPTLSEFIQELMANNIKVDPFIAMSSYQGFMKSIAERFKDEFYDIFSKNYSEKYVFSSEEISKRKLKNTCLHYISYLDSSNFIFDVFKKADNMTDSIASLKFLCVFGDENSKKALDIFYNKWKNDALVMDKWFIVQASSRNKKTFSNIFQLIKNPLFSIKNPNRARSVIGAFAGNPFAFHRKDGKGYDFLADMIIKLSFTNPQISARFVSFLSNYKGFCESSRDMMYESLDKIYKVKDLSKDVYEMVSMAVGC
ncbi:MAG: aminopeptidase N [Deltaproteobacteria bacterium]|nr:MAG: aminopeptidase N [Deltaproteobacteria bacterium]PIE75025.1 MAG: aminopeptidase N [Deltaproteobacteria bacterium]